jgi:hypothetical protein
VKMSLLLSGGGFGTLGTGFGSRIEHLTVGAVAQKCRKRPGHRELASVYPGEVLALASITGHPGNVE